MRKLLTPCVLVALLAGLCSASTPATMLPQSHAAPGHYLIVWVGDRAKKGNDFLAVIDADLPRRPTVGS